jgi:hypothetical protein
MLNIEMVYQLHKNTLIILFSTLLIFGILYYIKLPSIHLEVHGLQNASVQNSNSNNNNTKPAIANITNNGNVVEKASDKGMYRIQLRSNELTVLLLLAANNNNNNNSKQSSLYL